MTLKKFLSTFTFSKKPIAKSLCLKSKFGPITLPGGSVAITCKMGKIWVTREGFLEDFILGPGERINLKQREKVVVQSFEDSSLEVHM